MTQIPAGWYADPDSAPSGVPLRLRYWDGDQWTNHVSWPEHEGGAEPGASDRELVLAGWWMRLLAYVIDLMIVGLVFVLATLWARPGLSEPFAKSTANSWDHFSRVRHYYGVPREELLLVVLIGLVVAVTYFSAFLRWRNASPGKLMLGLRVRVVDRAGPLPWRAIASRVGVQFALPGVFQVPGALTSSEWLIAAGAVASVGFRALDGLWAAPTSRRQALHDKAAGSIVVQVPRRRAALQR